MLIPAALAIAAPVQWVACGGGPAKVKATTRSATPGPKGGMRDLFDSPHDLGCAVAISGQQDNLRPPDMLLATIPIGYHRLQRATVGGIQCSVMWVLSCIP